MYLSDINQKQLNYFYDENNIPLDLDHNSLINITIKIIPSNLHSHIITQ